MQMWRQTFGGHNEIWFYSSSAMCKTHVITNDIAVVVLTNSCNPPAFGPILRLTNSRRPPHFFCSQLSSIISWGLIYVRILFSTGSRQAVWLVSPCTHTKWVSPSFETGGTSPVLGAAARILFFRSRITNEEAMLPKRNVSSDTFTSITFKPNWIGPHHEVYAANATSSLHSRCLCIGGQFEKQNKIKQMKMFFSKKELRMWSWQ